MSAEARIWTMTGLWVGNTDACTNECKHEDMDLSRLIADLEDCYDSHLWWTPGRGSVILYGWYAYRNPG